MEWEEMPSTMSEVSVEVTSVHGFGQPEAERGRRKVLTVPPVIAVYLLDAVHDRGDVLFA